MEFGKQLTIYIYIYILILSWVMETTLVDSMPRPRRITELAILIKRKKLFNGTTTKG